MSDAHTALDFATAGIDDSWQIIAEPAQKAHWRVDNDIEHPVAERALIAHCR